MNLSQTPHLPPLFKSIGWKCLDWTPGMVKGHLTDEMRAAVELIDGVKTLGDLVTLGIEPKVLNQLIEQDVVVLLPGRLTHRKDKPPTEKWSVISPHSDDAALSIGGLLAGLDDSVEISLLTMIGPSRCAGTCAPLYGDVEAVTHIRSAEDHLYGGFIGASVVCADIQDVEMYVDANGARWAERIMDHPDDVRLELYLSGLKKYFEKYTPDVILAPLAVGAHGDHLATHLALSLILPDMLNQAPDVRVYFYEDLPYCHYDQPALSRRLQEFNNLEPMTVRIDATQKARGISIYRSQYVAADIAWDVLDYAEKISAKKGVYAERLWKISDNQFK